MQLIDIISLKVSNPRKQVIGVFKYHTHQRQHIIMVYAWTTNHKHMLFQGKTLSFQIELQLPCFKAYLESHTCNLSKNLVTMARHG
jgi:hypothetical protein